MPWPSSSEVQTGTLAFFSPRETKPAMPLAGSWSLAATVAISSIVFGKATPFASKSSLL
ncbi:hypothetical protein D3C86_2221980 [compost metagenome]